MLYSPVGFLEKRNVTIIATALRPHRNGKACPSKAGQVLKTEKAAGASYILVVVEVVEVLVVFFAFVFLVLVVVVSVSANAATVPNVKPANTRAATIFFIVNLSLLGIEAEARCLS
jgi:hypothetical protein